MDESTTALRTCTKCGIEKALNQFNRNKSSALGRDTKCRTCKAAYLAARRAADPDATRAAQRAYRAQNVERIREQDRASKARHAATIRMARRARYLANSEKAKADAARWHEQNPEKAREIRQRWRAANPEKAAQAVRDWNSRNPEVGLLSTQRRRARIAGSSIGVIDLEALWTGVCGICHEALDRAARYPDPMSKSLDHIVPLSKGGAHKQSNLQWTHLICNIRKGARHPKVKESR